MSLPYVLVRICVEDKAQYIVVKGKTYPIKEELKKLGFRWDPATQDWSKNVTNDEEIRNICNMAIEKDWEVSFLDFTSEYVKTGKHHPSITQMRRMYYEICRAKK